MKKYFFLFSVAISSSVCTVVTNAEEINSLANNAVTKARSFLGAAIGEDMPDWAKRIEWSLDFNEDEDLSGSILTVQPLYQDPERHDTFFTQASYYNYEQFGDRKNTTNIGLGYRHVTQDNSLLLGANIFYDREWDEGHNRLGYGIEAKLAMFDFTANYYDALSGSENISSNVTERALDGYNIELRSQVPYMPWARVGVSYYSWDSKDFDDIEGVKASLDMDITPNLGLEFGASDDNDSSQDAQFFANLTYSFGDSGKARPLSDNTGTLMTDGIDSKAFVMRDMRDQTLNKVRRQNKIITERNSSGITISRAN